jgi:hypothetical protein
MTKDRLEDLVDPNLSRKFQRWVEENHSKIPFLVKSLFLPIIKDRSENRVAVVRLKELPVAVGGFKILSVDNSDIVSLAKDEQEVFNDM